jgi:putative membrane-bound dehydrogenase-like protein
MNVHPIMKNFPGWSGLTSSEAEPQTRVHAKPRRPRSRILGLAFATFAASRVRSSLVKHYRQFLTRAQRVSEFKKSSRPCGARPRPSLGQRNEAGRGHAPVLRTFRRIGLKPLHLAGAVLGLLAPSAAIAYKEVAPPERVVLPAARGPAQSLASITVPAGMEVELVAAEPHVMDPIDIAWGADGKMWVVEMADYPLGMDGKGKPGGRIRFLESTRGDGRYDRMMLFAEGLNFPTSVMPWRNGVLVTAIPDVLLLEDTNGDGRADRSTKLFTGLGLGNQQHLTNGLQWSLDGWLHMANGNSGGTISSPQQNRVVEVGQRDFRLSPDNGGIELVYGRSQVGRNRDDWGNWFGCNNSNPIWHFALEDKYLRRNPHLAPPNATVTVAAVPGAARVYPTSETLARFNDPNGHNHITSACGVMIYRDEWLEAEYAGNVFVCEPVHNLVHREIVRAAGVTFKSERAPGEQESEFFASTDNWSRFTAVRAGPDGALYIVDMYRLVIEHPKWIPEAWQKELGDLRAGETQGRIYRVRPKGMALRPVPKLDQADTAAVVAALESPSGIVRDLAQQQLAWRMDKSAVPALERLAISAARPASRAQALWSLHSLDAITAAIVVRALQDPHPGVRRQAVRLSETFSNRNPELLERVAGLVDDADPSVRLQVAYTLGEWKQPVAGVALARLLRADDDRFIRAAAMSSALPHADTLIAQLGASGRGDDPLLIEIATVTENAKALASLLEGIAASRGPGGAPQQFRALALLLDWLQRNNKSLSQLQSSGGEAMKSALTAADGVFSAARAMASNPKVPVEERIVAAKVLGRGRARQTEDFELLAGLLIPASPSELQLAAMTTLGRTNRASVAERVLDGWGGYSGPVRTAALELVMSRPAWAQVLLDRVEADPTMMPQIDAGRRAALTQHSNAKLAERATAIFNSGTDVNREKVIVRYTAAIAGLPADPAKGAHVFASTCSACHKFGAVAGSTIGPDIAVVKDRSVPYLLTHILDPNRAVEDRYIYYTATTHDGRALAGMLAGEAGNSITLLGLDGKEQSILRSEIRSLVSSGRSLMPDGLEAAINEQAMADLIAFLAGGDPASRANQ